MILEIFALVLLLIVSGYFYLYFFPKRKVQKFAQYAQGLGYKVKLIPFQFLQYYMAVFQQQQQGSLTVFKQELGKYDLAVGNMFGNLALIPISTGLQKDFYNQLGKLPKNPFISQVFLKFLNGGGIVFTEGQVWKRKRRIISSVFHYDFLNDMIPVIEQIIDYHLIQVDQAISEGKTINIQILMVKILASVITKCFFGTDMRQYKVQGRVFSDYFVQYLEDLNAFAVSPDHAFLGMLGPKYGLTKRSRLILSKLKIIHAISKQVTLKEIQKIKNKQTTQKNLLTTLFEKGLLSLDGNSTPQQYSMEELIGQFFTFVGAGTDSSSHAINLIFHYLSQNQVYLEKIRQQLQILKQRKELSSSEALKQMTWTEAVFNETLRINGPVSQIIPRISSEQIYLESIKIPKGTSFNVLPLINHYKSEYFENPGKFMPERWLNDSKIQPYSFMPFAGGQRNCIGQYLVRVQTKLILKKLIDKYEFKALNPIKMKKLFFFITLHGDFEMKIRHKQK